MGLFDGFFGGGSGGNSTSNTTSIDKRMVVDGQGLGVSSDSSTVNLLDSGAIKQAVELSKYAVDSSVKSLSQMLDFSAAGVDLNAQNFDTLLDFAGGVYGKAFSSLEAAQKSVSLSGDVVAKAYDNAKGEGDQKTTLYIVAGAVIALVALSKMKL